VRKLFSYPWILLGAVILLVVFLAEVNDAETIIVDHDGNGDYVSIQDAINHSAHGDMLQALE